MLCTPNSSAPTTSTSMLKRFKDAKETEIRVLEQRFEKEGMSGFKPFLGTRPGFAKALQRKKETGHTPIIAEYKRASPSRGEINLKISPEEAAKLYTEAGAAALSVLTESRYFGGSLDYPSLMHSCGLPLLRKDFIFHPLQIAATGTLPVSAVLIIVRLLSDDLLSEILQTCYRHTLEAVVEVFSESDLKRAQEHNVRIIQVNNRDLDTLETRLDTSRRLISCKQDELWISASGYTMRTEIQEMQTLGFDAFLVGTSLMDSHNIVESLSALTGKNEHALQN